MLTISTALFYAFSLPADGSEFAVLERGRWVFQFSNHWNLIGVVFGGETRGNIDAN